jgi:hypothetical protein
MQEDHKFKVNQGSISRPCLQKKKKKNSLTWGGRGEEVGRGEEDRLPA